METQSGKHSVYIIFDNEEINIRNDYIEQLYFIEDIFSYSIVGKLQFHDRQGIMEFGPLTGNEKIVVNYGVDYDTEKTFDIYKINRIIPSWSESDSTDNFIEILFVDEVFYSLTNREYSKSWKDIQYSEIVRFISNNMLSISNFVNFEESIESADYFYIPFWTPKKTLDWLLKRCRGVNSEKSGYLFYNNSEGHNFITLESLLKQGNLMNSDKQGGVYSFKGKSLEDFNKILGYELSGIDNISRMYLKGGKRQGYDFSRKKFINQSYTYNDAISNYTLLGNRSLFEDISDSNVNSKNLGESEENIINNIYYNNWIKTYCMQQTMSIIVKGYEERHAGGLVEIEWPSTHEKEIYNKNLEGRYLVKSITHQFASGRPDYRQKMILMKNAYEDSDNTKLVKAKNKNLR